MKKAPRMECYNGLILSYYLPHVGMSAVEFIEIAVDFTGDKQFNDLIAVVSELVKLSLHVAKFVTVRAIAQIGLDKLQAESVLGDHIELLP